MIHEYVFRRCREPEGDYLGGLSATRIGIDVLIDAFLGEDNEGGELVIKLESDAVR